MANPDHLKILGQGAEVWNKWRGDNPDIRPDLSSANLSGTEYLIGANLTDANLLHADLRLADLTLSDLRHADLRFADLSSTYLGSADLSHADLSSADLTDARLGGANFSEVTMSMARIAHVDLRDVEGLDSVIHEAPSTIGTDTIRKSQGKIPEVFLRGCGLSDLEIEQAKLADPNLTDAKITDIGYKIIELRMNHNPLEFYSCFISYSSENEEFAKKLNDKLQSNGVRC